MFMQLLGAAETWQTKIMDSIDGILVPILVIACSVGMIYAIIVGINMMKADSKDKREENKARLINIAISIVAIAVLIALFYAVRSWVIKNKGDLKGQLGDIISNVGNPLLNTVNLVKQCASMIIFKC